MDRDTLRFLMYVVVGIAVFVLLVQYTINQSVLDYLW